MPHFLSPVYLNDLILDLICLNSLSLSCSHTNARVRSTVANRSMVRRGELVIRTFLLNYFSSSLCFLRRYSKTTLRERHENSLIKRTRICGQSFRVFVLSFCPAIVRPFAWSLPIFSFTFAIKKSERFAYAAPH